MIEYVASRPALATVVECRLVGEDAEHLEAVAAALFEEVATLERVLSRHDRTAELARVNRLAHAGPVRICRILADALAICEQCVALTRGAFDPCAGTGKFHDVTITTTDPLTVQYQKAGLAIDLGGFAKGYILDRITSILWEQNVTNYFIHAGTSSIVARGRRAEGSPWRVQIPHRVIDLDHSALSTSVAQDSSAIRVPDTGDLVRHGASCTVVGPSGACTEAFSTARIVDPTDWVLPEGYQSYFTPQE